MPKGIPTVNLYKNFDKLLKEYGEELRGDLQKAVLETSNDALKYLRTARKPKTGKYNKGWTKEVQTSRWGSVSVVFYNKTNWQLTHLLNDGYEPPSGGRVPGDGHIDDASKYASKLLVEKAEEKLRK